MYGSIWLWCGGIRFFFYIPSRKKKLCQSEDPLGTGSLKFLISLGKMADFAGAGGFIVTTIVIG